MIDRQLFQSFIRFVCVVGLVLTSACSGYEQNIEWASPRPIVDVEEITDEEAYSEEPDVLDKIPYPTGRVNLEEALLLSLKYNPRLNAYREEVRARDAAVLQASLYPNPGLGLETEEFGGDGDKSGFDNAEFTAKVSQRILLGGDLEERTNLAKADRDLGAMDYEVSRIEVFTEVVGRFYRVLALQKRVELAGQTVQLAEQVTESVTTRVDAGGERPIEQTRAEVALEKEKLKRARVRRQLRNAKVRLSSLWGQENVTFERVTGAFGNISELPNRKKLVHHVRKNPQIKRWDLALEKRKSKLNLEEAKAIPDPKLQFGVSRKREIDQTLGIFGVEFPLQIFNRNQGAVQEAKHRIRQMKWKQKNARKNVMARFAAVYRELKQLTAEVRRIKKDVVPKSKEVFEKIKEGYDEGEFDLLEVLDARRTFFEAQSRYIQVLSEYHAARADVEGLVGRDINSFQ